MTAGIDLVQRALPWAHHALEPSGRLEGRPCKVGIPAIGDRRYACCTTHVATEPEHAELPDGEGNGARRRSTQGQVCESASPLVTRRVL